MNYNVTDKDGWTLAEGRIQRSREQRNREEATRIIDCIERNQRIARLVRASNKGPSTWSDTNLLDKAQPESKVVDFLHYRNRELHEPMATRRIDALKTAKWLTTIGIVVAFWYFIYALVF